MELTDILFFIVFISAAIPLWLHFKGRIGKQRATNEIWREFARMKGLQEQPAEDSGNASSGGGSGDLRKWSFDGCRPFIAFLGNHRGLPFALECLATEGTPRRVGRFTIASGEGIRIFTRIRIGLSGLPPGFCIYHESVWSKLGKGIGMQDITTGDSAFDKMFVVKGNAQMEVLNFLTPSRRMALEGLADKFWRMELREGELVLMQPGQTERMEQLDQYLADIDRFSTALQG